MIIMSVCEYLNYLSYILSMTEKTCFLRDFSSSVVCLKTEMSSLWSSLMVRDVIWGVLYGIFRDPGCVGNSYLFKKMHIILAWEPTRGGHTLLHQDQRKAIGNFFNCFFRFFNYSYGCSPWILSKNWELEVLCCIIYDCISHYFRK